MPETRCAQRFCTIRQRFARSIKTESGDMGLHGQRRSYEVTF
jgi:hypothetical protein